MASLSRTASRARSVTIRDVAARAHASAGTVSRVLNGAPNVKEAVRRRVEAAIHELQYVPNAQARALSSKAFHTIAAVIPSIRNLNFVIFVRALQEALAREGYTLLFSAHEFDLGVELEEVRTFSRAAWTASCWSGRNTGPSCTQPWRKDAAPMSPPGRCRASQARTASAWTTSTRPRGLTRYLLDLGHREFAVVASLPPANDSNALRLQGVKAELGRAGIDAAGRPHPRGRGLDRGGQERDPPSSLAWPRRPTAVICVNDFLAFGALLECQALGIAVPAQMSIAGFGDIQFASDTQPPLTTVRMPAADIGASQPRACCGPSPGPTGTGRRRRCSSSRRRWSCAAAPGVAPAQHTSVIGAARTPSRGRLRDHIAMVRGAPRLRMAQNTGVR